MNGVLEFDSEGAKQPRQHNAVHPVPRRTGGAGRGAEDMVGESIPL